MSWLRGNAAPGESFWLTNWITTGNSPKRPVQQPTRTWSVKLNATKPQKQAGASAGTENARRKQNSAGGGRYEVEVYLNAHAIIIVKSAPCLRSAGNELDAGQQFPAVTTADENSQEQVRETQAASA